MPPLQTLPGLFISHGSPYDALDAGASTAAYRRLAANLPKPRAILVLSAHWQTVTLEVASASHPETWHDFRHATSELYQLRYPAAGAPGLAEWLTDYLHQSGFTAQTNPLRPRDHGVWSPLRHLYPAADVPVVQLSLPTHLRPSQLHYLGRVLAPLRDYQMLLVGSGSITHNLNELDAAASTAPHWAREFKQWMIQQLIDHNTGSLFDWRTQAPFAQRNHPTDEHLRPLFFALGTGSRASVVHSRFSMGSLGMDIYRFD